MRAGRGKMPMYGLVDVDITTANRLLAGQDPPWSLTAFVVASVARAAAAHPEVHAYRNWRGQAGLGFSWVIAQVPRGWHPHGLGRPGRGWPVPGRGDRVTAGDGGRRAAKPRVRLRRPGGHGKCARAALT
jgi:hypothetical protein